VNATPASLAEVLGRYQITLPDEQVAQLERYCALLWEWNARLNLTRHTDYEKFVARDLIDSLVFAEFLDAGEKVVDVGTGGGVPGVVLAIVRPDLKLTLTDSVGKKVKAVSDIVARLGLPVPVYHGRAEQLVREQRQNTLVIRAVARLVKLLDWFSPHWQRFDRLLILKGPSWLDERGEARHFGKMHDVSLRKLKSYQIAGDHGESVLLQIRPKAADGNPSAGG
jgi:16S rRNA (guanine527-N7)-methyltransferase